MDRPALRRLMADIEAGKVDCVVVYKVGEHEPIVSTDIFEKVQTLLLRNRYAGSTKSRNRHGALLRRLLYCKACGHTMVHNFTGRGGRQRLLEPSHLGCHGLCHFCSPWSSSAGW